MMTHIFRDAWGTFRRYDDVLDTLGILATLGGGSYEGDVGTSFVPPLNPLDRPADIEGPRNAPTEIPDPDFAAVQTRYVAKFADWPSSARAISETVTNRNLVNAIFSADFLATGDRQHFRRVLLADDPQLRGLYSRS